MSQGQQQKIQHSLSRFALAKAIKTPEEGDLEAEPWNKSVIFNQPFIKELQKQKHLSIQLPQQQLGNKNHRRDKSNELKPQIQTNSNRKSQASPSIEKRLSELSINKKSSAAKISIAHRASAYLPSDSEEEEDEGEGNKEDEEEEEESSVDSEVFLPAVKKMQPRPVSYPLKVSPQSLESSSQDDVIHSPSTRGSSSSHTLPLTDEDDVELTPPPSAKIQQQQQQQKPQQQQQQQKPQQQKRQNVHVRSNSWIPQQEYHNITNFNRLQKQPLQQPYQAQQQLPLPPIPQIQQQPKYNNRPLSMSMEMMDPMYYQRLQQQQQQYQHQLQYQQQIQYQQAMVLQQQQQQQQIYLLSKNPSPFFPPGSRVIEEPATINTTSTTMTHHAYNNKRHSAASTAAGFNTGSNSGHNGAKQVPDNKKNGGYSNSKMTSTDKRRRAEMKRMSSSSAATTGDNNRASTPTLYIQENSPAMYFQQLNTTPLIMRNSHSNHSNISRRTSYHF